MRGGDPAAEPLPEAVALASCRAGTLRIERCSPPEEEADAAAAGPGVGGMIPCWRGAGGPLEVEEVAREEEGKDGHDGNEVPVLRRCEAPA